MESAANFAASVVIPHSSLLDALGTCHKLKTVLGQTAFLDTESFGLRVPMSHVDDLIVESFRNPQLPSTSPVSQPPERADRRIPLTIQQGLELTQIEADYLLEWEKAREVGDRGWEMQARRRQKQRIAELREKVVSLLLPLDIDGVTLIYGASPLLSQTIHPVEVIPFPDGKKRKVKTLIHYCHPSSSEELYLRECRVEAEKIVRYFIEGIDEVAEQKQKEPCGRLDAIGWREVLVQSFKV